MAQRTGSCSHLTSWVQGLYPFWEDRVGGQQFGLFLANPLRKQVIELLNHVQLGLRTGN